MRVYVIHINSRYPSLRYWTHSSVLCKMGEVKGLSLSASRTDSIAQSTCPMTPPASVSLLVGPLPILPAAPAQPLTRSTCWGRSCPEGQNALAGRVHNPPNKMKHNCNASPGEGQSDGPSPRLLSPQAALLPGLGPRPSSSLSWPLPWGCSTGKVPIGGPSCDPSSRMGAAPHSGATAVSRLDTSAPELSPPISHYDHHYSHYDHRSHTRRSHTLLSHTTLSHTTLRHTALTLGPSALLSLEEMARRLCLQHVS